MTRRLAPALLVSTLMITLTACNMIRLGDEPNGTDRSNGKQARQDAGTATDTPPAQIPDSPQPGDDAGEASGTDSGEGGAPQEGSPKDQDLAIERIHPSQVTLSVSRLSFKDGNIYVDAEFVNSSRAAVTYHIDSVTGDRLRLVDDAGQEYNFVEPDGENPLQDVQPGETVGGTLAFRGPLRGRPQQLLMVNNLNPDEVADYDLESQSDTTVFPAFVVPLDLAGE